MGSVVPESADVYYSGDYWNELEPVHRYMCENFTGDPEQSWQEDFKRRFAARPFKHALFLNCGNGWVERQFLDLGIADRATAFDYSRDLVDAAIALRGDLEITYLQADANHLDLEPRQFDLVVNVAALHHVQKLNRLCRVLCASMTADGILVNFEYIGPGRNQYSREQWRLIQEANASLPPQIRRDRLVMPHVPTMMVTDPTEAIHSDLIIQLQARYFDIFERHDSGGGIAYELLTHNAKLRHVAPAELAGLVEPLLEVDRTQTQQGRVPPMFSYFMARPRKAVLSKRARLARYQVQEDLRETVARRFGGAYSWRQYRSLTAGSSRLRRPSAATLALGVAALSAWLGTRAVVYLAFAAGTGGSLKDVILTTGGSYDASWYETIVLHGYQHPHAGVAAFSPGFPLVADAVFWPVVFLSGRPPAQPWLATTMVIVANVALLLALVAFWKLYSPRIGRRITLIGITLFLALPGAFFLSAGYAESLFIAALAWMFIMIERKQWAWAGLMGGLACLVRPTGFLVLIPLAIAWLQAPRPRPLRATVIGVAALMVGVGGLPLFHWLTQGDPLLQPKVQAAGWPRHVVSPVATLARAFDFAHQAERTLRGRVTAIRPPEAPGHVAAFGGLVLAVGAAVAGWRKLRLWEAGWIAAALLFPLTFNTGLELNRYVLTVFPAYFGFAWVLRRVPDVVVAGMLIAVGLGFEYQLAREFATGYFVG